MADEAKKTILVAEDDVGLLKAITLRLTNAGYHVVAVQDGYQALERCRREKPDLLLMDIGMPAGSGLSVHERMRDNDTIAASPVVYMTGNTDEAVVRQAREMEAVAVLRKPVQADELLATVEAALRGGRDMAA